MKSNKKSKFSVRRIVGRLSVLKVLAMLIAVVCFISAVAMTVTSQPGFCNSCHIMNSYYDSWKHSSHHEVSCLSCHLKPGFNSYMKGKINGLSQAVDCMVGRIGTAAHATVADESCLRSACHNIELLEAKAVKFGEVKFTHKGHIGNTIDGITISCGTCHNHVGGQDHFEVNKGVCFTCHFLDDKKTEEVIVESECQDCHEVPDKVIEQGMVKINHAEFVSYEASCNDSCHKKQVEAQSNVAETICLNCHPFTMGHDEEDENIELLHEHHTTGEKVECFACHGDISHGPTRFDSVSAMIDCKDCHSDTHNIQQTIYTAEEGHPKSGDSDKILSPMFLTHVQCTGCHIEKTAIRSGALESLGTVAKSVPRACDNCHEPGTGEKYIPFWQKKIKGMFAQTSKRLDKFEQLASIGGLEQDEKTVKKSIEQVRAILRSVEADGSWGVHNLKYTEEMLLRANKIISQIK
ncbi:MAG TPA: hypothetical protein ENH94_04480 [Phycisphaerales bacterium]|nr:hypothetical protein [Phycisphaerales bacterium]